MKKPNFKKAVSLAICGVITLTNMSSVASASEEKILSEKEVHSIIQDTALEWAIMNGKSNLSISDVSEVKTSDGSVLFEADYYNALPYGYAIITLIDDEFVVKHNINVNGETSGRCITVLGYIEAIKVSSGNTWNYIMVHDGWGTKPCYINYDCVDFMDYTAAYFKASK